MFRKLCSIFLLLSAAQIGFAQTARFDVVINELMIKPTPVVGLPVYEYVELFNGTDAYVNLHNWKITIGKSEQTLSQVEIPPRGYLLIVKKGNEGVFNKYDNIATIDNLQLNDEAQEIMLYDPSLNLIHRIDYDLTLRSRDPKSKGGWSLEQIDPDNPCGGYNNWQFSISRLGGTPNALNSVNADNKDIDKPALIRAAYVDHSHITLHFSEPLIDSNELTAPNNYFGSDGLGTPDSVSTVGTDNMTILIKFATQMKQGVIHTLSVADNVFCDCVGNKLPQGSEAKFGIPDSLQPDDLLISEIMFNPEIGNSAWIELFNPGNKLIDLAAIALLIDNTPNYPPSFYIMPNQYIVLKNTAQPIGNYHIPNPNNIVSIPKMTSLNIRNGHIAITDKGDHQSTFDQLYYNETMHHPIISNPKGVSLEKISMLTSSDDITNWQSATKACGFATPTSPNSVNLETPSTSLQWTLSSQTFSPDNDGYEDSLGIIYSLDQAGKTADITIYNQNGEPVRNLTNNYLLPSQGIIIWNGTDNQHRKCPIGIYIIHIKLTNTDGKKEIQKLIVTLATRF